MKKVLLALFIALLMVSFAQAADDIKPKTQQGDRAIFFSFNGMGGILLSGLSSVFAGGEGSDELVGSMGHPNLNSSLLYAPGIGGLYYLNDDMALRFGLAFGQVKSDEDEDGNISHTNSMMGISGGIQKHLANVTGVSVYTGAELYYGSLSATAKNEDAKMEQTTSYKGMAVAGLLGVQFYPWKNFSFDFEYKLGYASFKPSGEMKMGDDSEDWQGGATTVMGISNWSLSLDFHF